MNLIGATNDGMQLSANLVPVYEAIGEGDTGMAAWHLTLQSINEDTALGLQPWVEALHSVHRPSGNQVRGLLRSQFSCDTHVAGKASGAFLATVEAIPRLVVQGSARYLASSDHPYVRPIFQSPETLLADVRRIIKPVVDARAVSGKVSLLEEIPTKEAVVNLVRWYDDLVAAGKRDPEKIWEDLDDERELLMTIAVLFMTSRYDLREVTARLFCHPSHRVRISAIKVQLALNEGAQQATKILYQVQERMFLQDINSGNDGKILEAVALFREFVRLGEVKALHWLRIFANGSRRDPKVRHAAFIALDDLDLLEEDI